MGFADELRNAPAKLQEEREKQEEQDWLDFIDYLMNSYIKGFCMREAKEGKKEAVISLSFFYENYFREYNGISPDGEFIYRDYNSFDDQKRVRVCRKFIKAWNDSYSYDPDSEMPKELGLKPSMASRLEKDIRTRMKEEGLIVEKIARKEQDGTYLCYEMKIWAKW